MRARLALALSASFAQAAWQGDDITPTAARSMNASQAQEHLLTLVPEAALTHGQQTLLSTIRGRASTAEVHLARVAAAPGGQLRGGGAIRLAVAPGVNVVALPQHLQQRGDDDLSWSGPVQGGGWAQLVYMQGGVTATVTVGGAQYAIEPLGGGLHAVSRIDQGGFPQEHPAGNFSGVLVDNDRFGGAAARNPNDGAIGIQAVSTQNVLVVYTASAASAAGNIASKIQLAVDETNQSYANSGIQISMTRVYTGQVTYSESGRSFGQHVSALQGTTDGLMDNVHTLRNTYAADIVVLVVNDSEACGQAAAIRATASSAFAVAHYSCITGYYSFGHEIGHLQGARHDRYVDGSTSPFSYGHGYIPPSKGWRTVMAYGNNCANCTRVQYWSTPLRTYPPTGEVLGTATYEDNARVLNGTAATVAAFR
ncbi:MAG TPA: M12 family metallo-peptidase [Longimicrobium sp.]|nr:M12 family metallo-peptidase [Longimicrobium sp.]